MRTSVRPTTLAWALIATIASPTRVLAQLPAPVPSAGTTQAASEPQPATLEIDGSPVVLDAPPIVVQGSVFVPLRGVFERLGARVTFVLGEIDVSTGVHRIVLHLGRPLITVDGVSQPLSTPPLLVATHTYVPLGIVATALGARVRFDRSARVVFIEQAHAASLIPGPGSPAPTQALTPASASPPASLPASANAPLPSDVPTLAPGSIALRVVREEPARNTTVARTRPEISASFAERVDTASIHVIVDGRDATSDSRVSEGNFVYEPSLDLPVGTHEVFVSGRTPLREPFADRWTFDTATPHGHNFLTGIEPPSGITVTSPVVIDGLTRPRARVSLIAASSETASHFSELSGGAISAHVLADDRGRFSFRIDLVDTSAGFLDVRLASTAGDGGVAVRTLRLRV